MGKKTVDQKDEIVWKNNRIFEEINELFLVQSPNCNHNKVQHSPCRINVHVKSTTDEHIQQSKKIYTQQARVQNTGKKEQVSHTHIFRMQAVFLL